jgi:hypothetical protein
MFLLTKCFAVPKITYLLRTTPAFLRRELLMDIDSTFRRTLERITNVKMDDTTWQQASLPVAVGGLGIRSVNDIALPAYCSSLHATRHLVEAILHGTGAANLPFLQAESALELYGQLPGAEMPIGTERNHQRRWDEPLVLHRQRLLLEDTQTVHDRARLLAVAERESGRWLHAVPSPQLGTYLDNESLRIAVALRLGSDMCVPHACICGQPVSSTGRHGLACKRSLGRHPRHHALNETIRRALVSSGVPSILEPVGLDRDDGKRPDGATLIPWSGGRTLVWDATCVDTLATSNIGVTSQTPGSAAGRAEERKKAKYEGIATHHLFIPVGFETLGTFGPSAKQFLAQLGRRLIETTFEPRASEYLQQRISLDIMRGNAAAVLGTLPSTTQLGEIFYLQA